MSQYIEVTQLERSNAKWQTFLEKHRTKQYIAALATSRSVDPDALFYHDGNQVFAHPSLALCFAQWISPALLA
jgi:hypothetical protein